jgi:hypothetical protein
MIARALVAALWVLAGCGARTGLRAPDAGHDAGVDAPYDAGHDAGPPPRCIVVPANASPVVADFSIPAALQIVDVMFLVDVTGSMRDEIANVRAGLRDVVLPGVQAAIPDAEFGLALFGEFPLLPYARPDSGVHPYELRTPITADVERLSVSFDSLPSWGNLDDPEADIEGCFQVATGAGLPPYVDASFGCPSGGAGGGCFRSDAFRVVLLATDAPMHNGPPGVPPIAPYTFRDPSAHTYEETVAALRALDATVIGLGAFDTGHPSPLPHLRALAADVDTHHMPLVFDIGDRGDQIGQSVVMALETLAAQVPLDVSADMTDLPGQPLDARLLVSGIRAVSADPMSNIGGISGSTFTAVIPGTHLTFAIDLDASRVPPSTMRREVHARVIFRDGGRTRIGSQDVLLVIPGSDGRGCP